MAQFLFLHGSWHGAWCWYKVLAQMAERGHQARAIDLPGRGRTPAAPALVGLKRMVDAAQNALFAEGKTTVVVHSRNGIVASALAERVPEAIARTIYLASFMLPNGRRVLDYLPDRDSLLPGNVQIGRIGLWDWLDPAIYQPALYADCAAEDISLARTLLVREPLRPALTRLRLSPARYGQVPRSYIRLSQDRAVSPALQDRLLADTAVDRVETLHGSHSVYFSQPQALSELIIDLAE
ncbi:MAG: alpha/beta fold hydrolase [Xanthomonadales bacterium]|nr:alpha/beta fold hydrolase [Xanthomonadales bacterium]